MVGEDVAGAAPSPPESESVQEAAEVRVAGGMGVHLLRSPGRATRERDLPDLLDGNAEPSSVRRVGLLIGEQLLLGEDGEAPEVGQATEGRVLHVSLPRLPVERVGRPQPLDQTVEPSQLQPLERRSIEPLQRGVHHPHRFPHRLDGSQTTDWCLAR